MSKLLTTPRLPQPDDLYEQLVRMHEGLTPAASLRLNSRLILLLFNHIGDQDVLAQAMQQAVEGLRSES